MLYLFDACKVGKLTKQIFKTFWDQSWWHSRHKAHMTLGVVHAMDDNLEWKSHCSKQAAAGSGDFLLTHSAHSWNGKELSPLSPSLQRNRLFPFLEGKAVDYLEDEIRRCFWSHRGACTILQEEEEEERRMRKKTPQPLLGQKN